MTDVDSQRGSLELRPGSDEALAAGCRCPVLDNAHGRGWMGVDGAWVLSGDCPLHAHEIMGTI